MLENFLDIFLLFFDVEIYSNSLSVAQNETADNVVFAVVLSRYRIIFIPRKDEQ